MENFNSVRFLMEQILDLGIKQEEYKRMLMCLVDDGKKYGLNNYRKSLFSGVIERMLATEKAVLDLNDKDLENYAKNMIKDEMHKLRRNREIEDHGIRDYNKKSEAA